MEFCITRAEGGGVVVSWVYEGDEYSVYLEASEAMLIANRLVECAEADAKKEVN